MYRRGVRRAPLMAPGCVALPFARFPPLALPLEPRESENRRERANARVAPRLWLHSAACFALAVLFFNNTPALWVSLAAYAVFYVTRYRDLVLFRSTRPRRAAEAVEGPDGVKRPHVS
jgi:hypothetical protein